jgi:hypothetical protein
MDVELPQNESGALRVPVAQRGEDFEPLPVVQILEQARHIGGPEFGQKIDHVPGCTPAQESPQRLKKHGLGLHFLS